MSSPRPKSMAPTSRSVAAIVLSRVFADQAFAAATLDAELEKAVQLQPKDRRLATELTYGVLRCLRSLEARLGLFTPRGLSGLDPRTRAHLLIAAYQLLALDRIPAFAVVSEAVRIVRAERGEGLARFANAVLRRLADHARTCERLSVQDAMVESAQPWLFDRLAASLGSAELARAYLTAGPWPPPTCLRLKQQEDRMQWLQRLAESEPRAKVTAGRLSPVCILVQGIGTTAQLPGYSERWIVQEEGSQLVGLALGASPGETVLDACAGRGNKSSLLSEIVGCHGAVDVADLHESKISMLQRQAKLLNAPVRACYVVDWSVGSGDVPGDYDRVLVDAPCSGTGTLRRRPEMFLQSREGSLSELQNLQVAILSKAASRCRPGGRIVYSICSVLREEAEDVVARAQAALPWLQTTEFDSTVLRSLADGQTQLRLLPHVHGCDGYFIAVFRRAG